MTKIEKIVNRAAKEIVDTYIDYDDTLSIKEVKKQVKIDTNDITGIIKSVVEDIYTGAW